MSDPAGPVMADLGPTDRCYRCKSPEFVEPAAQITRRAEVRYVYECPHCLHAWWNAYNTSADEPWQVAA